MDLAMLLRRLIPILGEHEVQRTWEQIQLADAKTAKLIEIKLRRTLDAATGSRTRSGDGLLDPIPPTRSTGPLVLGRVFHGNTRLHPFALRFPELIQHAAIFGRSGAGKTNVAFLLLRELARHAIPFLVFDWKKNYRDLFMVPQFGNLVVYTVGRDTAPFFFNPLVPPAKVQPKEWIKKLAEIMGHAYFLGEGVMFVLQEAIDRLYRDFQVYDSPPTWPTFRDLAFRLRSRRVKGREAQWMESTLRAVGVLNFGAMDSVLNSGAHLPIDRLLKQQAVLELDALTNSDKTFLIEALLLWIHHHRMHEPGRERLKHVLMIEEAHHVLLKKKQELLGAEAVTDVILREIREFGEAIVLLDQLPSLISKPALENTHATITMNLKEKGDVTAASKAMLLESNEAKLLGQLPVGTAVVKLQSRWVKPFLVRFPLFAVRKGVVTNQVVGTRFRGALDVAAAARMMRAATEAVCRMIPSRQNPRQAPEEVALSENEMRLLQDVRDHPTSPVTERYSRLGLSAKQGTAASSRLVDRGLVRSVNVPVPGSHVRLLDLTRTGRNQLDLPPADSRRGGPEHRYWVERIAGQLRESGIPVEEEAPIGHGETVDLLVRRDGKRLAVEVETGKSDWRKNVEKCRRAQIRRVVIAVTRRDALRRPTAELEGTKLVTADRAAWVVSDWIRRHEFRVG